MLGFSSAVVISVFCAGLPRTRVHSPPCSSLFTFPLLSTLLISCRFLSCSSARSAVVCAVSRWILPCPPYSAPYYPGPRPFEILQHSLGVSPSSHLVACFHPPWLPALCGILGCTAACVVVAETAPSLTPIARMVERGKLAVV